MCAKKIPVEDVIAKTQTIESALEDPESEKSELVRFARSSMSWKDWLKYDLLRYFYIVGLLAANIFLLFEIARFANISDALGMIFLILSFVCLCILEYYGYNKIWPYGILTKYQ